MNTVLYNKAINLGASDFGLSRTKNKRFYVVYQNKIINFGQKGSETFIDHNDIKKRDAWRKRHSKILRKGYPAYLNKESPEYWNWNLTW